MVHQVFETNVTAKIRESRIGFDLFESGESASDAAPKVEEGPIDIPELGMGNGQLVKNARLVGVEQNGSLEGLHGIIELPGHDLGRSEEFPWRRILRVEQDGFLDFPHRFGVFSGFEMGATSSG